MLRSGFFLSQNVRETGVKDWQQSSVRFNKWNDTINLSEFNEFIANPFSKLYDIDLKLEFVELKPKAKLTDFVSCDIQFPNCAIVSLKAADFLKTLVLPKHVFWRVKMYRSGNIIEEEYFFFAWMGISLNKIDIKNSLFYELTDFISKAKIYQRFNAVDNALSWVREKPIWRSFEVISLPRDYETYDLLKITGSSAPTYISDAFISGYSQLRLTGLEFETPILMPKIVFF